MDRQQLFSKIDHQRALITEYPITDTMKLLRQAATDLQRSDILRNIEDVESRYYYMLRLLVDNPVDYTANTGDIQAELERIAAELQMALRASDDSPLAAIHRFQDLRPEETLSTLVSDYVAEDSRLRSDTSSLTDARARATLDRTASDIFNHIWARRDFDKDNTALIENIIADTDISATHRVMWTHALALSVSEVFRRDHLDILYKAAEIPALRTTAFTWLMFLLAINNPRYTAHTDFLRLIKLEDDDMSTFEGVFSAMILSRANAGDITSFLGDMGSRAASAMQSGTQVSPEELMKDGDIERLANIREQQQAGSDLYFKAFGRMRHFSFFSLVSNWFIPFDASHSALWEITDGEGAALADTLQRVPYLCDGDKYAILLSMAALPISHRATYISNLVDAQMSMMQMPDYDAAMSDAAKDVHSPADVVHLIRRFCEVHPSADKFRIVTMWKDDKFFNTELIDWLPTDTRLQLARTAFKNKDYRVVHQLLQQDWEKIYYGHELSDFDIIEDDDDSTEFTPRELSENELETLRLYGMADIKSEGNDGGRYALSLYLRYHPEDIEVLSVALGQDDEHLEHEREENLKILNKALEHHPENKTVLERRARLHYLISDYEASLYDYMHLDFLSPATPRYIMGIMRNAICMGDYEQVTDTGATSDAQSLGAEGIALMAAAYWLQGTRRKALEYISKMLGEASYNDIISWLNELRDYPGVRDESAVPLQVLIDIFECRTGNPRLGSIFD